MNKIFEKFFLTIVKKFGINYIKYMIINFKDEDFDNKIKNENVSVIQFSAAWCGLVKH